MKKGVVGSQVRVDLESVPVSFEKWAQPGHFAKTLSKGPVSTTWVWNLHADVHDFDTQTTNLEGISRRIFSAHFGQLAVIMIWLSGMFFSWCPLFKLRGVDCKSNAGKTKRTIGLAYRWAGNFKW